MSFNKIRLELARDHDFPDGSRERGYEFSAPLAGTAGSAKATGRAIAPAAACAAWSGELMRSGISFVNRVGPGRFITTCLRPELTTPDLPPITAEHHHAD